MKALFTAYPQHATELVRGLTRNDVDVIVCMGGDGTVNEVVNGLLDSDPFTAASARELPEVAVIPTGSANVLAGSLRIPRNPYDAAWHVARILKTNERATISVGHAAGRCFVVNAGVGIDADVIATMDRLRSQGTKASVFRYMPEVIGAWRRLLSDPPQITAIIDGQTAGSDLPVALVSNTNPWTFLGDLPVVTNPDTSIGSGLGFFGITSMSGLTGIIAAANLGGAGLALRRIFRIKQREVRADDARSVELVSSEPLKFQLDGEYIDERSDLTITVKDSALRFVAHDPSLHQPDGFEELAKRTLPYRIAAAFQDRVFARVQRILSRN